MSRGLESYLKGTSLVIVLVISLFATSNFMSSSQSQSNNVNPQIFQSNGLIYFKAENTKLVFSDNKSGSIVQIDNFLTGQNTNLSYSYPLWAIDTSTHAYDENIVSYSAYDANSFSSTIFSAGVFSQCPGGCLLMFWTVNAANMSVEVYVEADPANGGVDMKLDVSNLDSNLSIVSVDFPYLAGFTGLGNSSSDNLAIPYRDGLVVPDFQKALYNETLGISYPGTLSMQFFLIYDNYVGGIYEGAQDNASNYKIFEMLNTTFGHPAFNFFWKLYDSSIYPGNNFTMNYFISIDSFAGQSWADGAEVYQSWATKQWYTEEGTIENRTDIPNWFKNIGSVWVDNTNSTTVMSESEQNVTNYLPGQTVLMNFWGWGKYGFDKGYPNYYPPYNGTTNMLNAISQAHVLGEKVMLFFAGSFIDTNTTYNPEYPNETQFVIVGQGGTPVTENFHDGLIGAEVDRSSSWWVSEVVNFTVEAVRNYGADGVYLDDTALVPPVLDYANATSPTNSGSTWWQAEANIFTAVRSAIRQYNPEAIVTVEGVCETYIPFVDGFWDNQVTDISSGIPDAMQTPLFSFVYHEYALVFGTPLDYFVQDSTPFTYTLARATSFGIISAPSLLPYIKVTPSDVSFLQNVVQLEQNYSAYLRFGEELPISISSPNVEIVYPEETAGVIHDITLNRSSIYAGMFQSSNGSIAMVMINPAINSSSATVHFYPNEFGSSYSDVVTACSQADLGTAGGCQTTNNSGDISFTIRGLSSKVIYISPALQNATTQTLSFTNSSSTSSTSSVTHRVQVATLAGLLAIPVSAIIIIAGLSTYRRHARSKLTSDR